ncbi:MAG: hypothetical protein DWQ58_00570 [Microcystis aeruginosa TA09]|nr:MAG: hypothetical protein DWQ58_00570 [Microcystis aeruginosa TA09]
MTPVRLNWSDPLDLRVARGKTKNKRQTEVLATSTIDQLASKKPLDQMLWHAIDSDKQGDGECHPYPKSLNSD